jgi:hypothetical protein
MSPTTLYGNIVMTVEAMFGLILLAVSVRIRIRISGTRLGLRAVLSGGA